MLAFSMAENSGYSPGNIRHMHVNEVNLNLILEKTQFVGEKWNLKKFQVNISSAFSNSITKLPSQCLLLGKENKIKVKLEEFPLTLLH